MRIILNSNEVKSFESFINEYVNCCRESIAEVDKSMNEEIKNMTNDDLLKVLCNDLEMDVLFKKTQISDEESMYEIDDELFIKYNNFLSDTMFTMKPYTVKASSIIFKHQYKIKKAISFVKSLPFDKIINFTKSFINLFDLKDLFKDLYELVNSFITDENGLEEMNKIVQEYDEEINDILLHKC